MPKEITGTLSCFVTSFTSEPLGTLLLLASVLILFQNLTQKRVFVIGQTAIHVFVTPSVTSYVIKRVHGNNLSETKTYPL